MEYAKPFAAISPKRKQFRLKLHLHIASMDITKFKCVAFCITVTFTYPTKGKGILPAVFENLLLQKSYSELKEYNLVEVSTDRM